MSYDDEFEKRERAAAKELRRQRIAKMSLATKIGYYIIAPLILVLIVVVLVALVIGAVRLVVGA